MNMTTPTPTSVYLLDKEEGQQAFRDNLGGEPLEWACSCGCDLWMLYRVHVRALWVLLCYTPNEDGTTHVFSLFGAKDLADMLSIADLHEVIHSKHVDKPRADADVLKEMAQVLGPHVPRGVN